MCFVIMCLNLGTTQDSTTCTQLFGSSAFSPKMGYYVLTSMRCCEIYFGNVYCAICLIQAQSSQRVDETHLH